MSHRREIESQTTQDSGSPGKLYDQFTVDPEVLQPNDIVAGFSSLDEVEDWMNQVQVLMTINWMMANGMIGSDRLPEPQNESEKTDTLLLRELFKQKGFSGKFIQPTILIVEPDISFVRNPENIDRDHVLTAKIMVAMHSTGRGIFGYGTHKFSFYMRTGEKGPRSVRCLNPKEDTMGFEAVRRLYREIQSGILLEARRPTLRIGLPGLGKKR